MTFMRRLFITPFFLALIWVQSAHAVSLLRDPDLEHGLTKLSETILLAAGLNPDKIKIILVDDNSLNAFIIDQKHIFIHSGLITKFQTAGQLQAVIAHEAAHIANGHIQRRLANLDAAQRMHAYGLLLAAAVSVAVNPEAGMGIASGSTGSAARVFMGHTRTEEASADQSSFRYMTEAGVSIKHSEKVFELFVGQESLSSDRQDPYSRSHPFTKDRLRAVRKYAATVADFPETEETIYWFNRVKGKLAAFKQSPSRTLKQSYNIAELDLMRQAIAYHRNSQLQNAISKIDQAIQARPKDAFYLELKGQILLENRRFSQATEVYKQAVALAPRNAQILGGYGHALLAQGEETSTKKALRTLIKAHTLDNRDARVMRDLAVAYSKTRQPAMASATTAERYALLGDMGNAALQAQRAIENLPEGSSTWQRMQDILSAQDILSTVDQIK